MPELVRSISKFLGIIHIYSNHFYRIYLNFKFLISPFITGHAMNKLLSFALIFLLWLSYLSPVLAQQGQSSEIKPAESSQDTSKEQDDVIKVNTNVVQFDAIVTDKLGRQVRDLKAEDFEIREGGQVRQVDYCSYVPIQKEQSVSTKRSDAPPAVANLRRTVIFMVSNPLIEVYATGIGRESAFFNRYLNATWVKHDSTSAFKVLNNFIEQQMGPNDLVSILSSEDQLGTLSRFTADRRILRAAAETIRADPIKKRAKKITVTAGSPPEISQLIQQNLRVLGMLSASIDKVKNLPGRKLVVFISRGLATSPHIASTEVVRKRMQNLISAANKAGVTFYALDPRELDPEPGIVGGGLLDRDSLFNMAEETGGRIVYNTNDISLGFAKVVEENSGYYLLGYRTAPEVTEKPHKINVSVKRPGLAIRTRSTAYSRIQAATDTNLSRGNALAVLLNQPLEAKEIEINLLPLYIQEQDGGGRIFSLLNLDLRKHKPDIERPEAITKLDFVIQLIAPDGSVVKQEARTFKWSNAELAQAISKGVNLNFNVAVNRPGYYQVNVATREVETGLAGSASRFVEVPDLSTGKLFMSELLLFNSMINNDAPEASLSSLELSYTGLLNRSFSRKDTLKYQYYIYYGSSSAAATSTLTVQAKIKRDGKVIAETLPRAVTLSRSGQVPMGGEIPMETFPPGKYTLDVVVADTLKKDVTSSRSSEFAIH
ncbi:MAG TPA: VWA domain-containing protein [Pyrinomonadaceae bacterium]|nr:VWA domain-containing protein [Pyrinomonadaceae bacterium]